MEDLSDPLGDRVMKDVPPVKNSNRMAWVILVRDDDHGLANEDIGNDENN